MKSFFPLLFLLISLSASAQDAKDILKKAYQKCQSVQNGYYEFNRYEKKLNRSDTVKSSFHCFFKKLKDDTLFSSAFHRDEFFGKEYSKGEVYTGKEWVRLYPENKSVTIINKSEGWDDIIKNRTYNNFYDPLSSKSSFPLFNNSYFTNPDFTFTLLKDQKISESPCYHIHVKEDLKNGEYIMTYVSREYNIWIKKTDSIPIQFSITLTCMKDSSTFHEYNKYTLTKYELNKLKDQKQLTLESIPFDYRRVMYQPDIELELLRRDGTVPDWSLISTKGEKISLADVKGKVLLLHFLEKDCDPCLMPLSGFEALYQKYKDQGFIVISIDPYKKFEDGLDKIIAKEGVTFPVLFGDATVARRYHVSSFPVMYLIGRDGKVIYANEGFGDNTIKLLEKMIKINL